MKKFYAVVLSLIMMSFFAVPTMAKEAGVIYANGVSTIELQPDVAEFDIVITTKDKSSLENASIANKEISQKIYNDLGNMIDKSNGDYLKTVNYSAEPHYYYNNGKQIFEAFMVTNTITVHTKKITEIGMLIDKALNLGATNINNIGFKLEDYNAYANNLLAIATKKAVTQAETVAQASGQKLNGVKSLRTSCNTNNYSQPRFYKVATGMMDNAMSVENSTQVQGGAIKLYAVVDAEFYLK